MRVIDMPKRYQINEKQVIEIEKARKWNKDKNIEKRLKALLLHAEGKKRGEVAEKTGFAKSYISELVSKYCNNGIEAIIENKFGGNRRNMSFAEEEVFLAKYKKLAEQGQIIEVDAIKSAYVEKVGHNIGKGQIYRVLNRHGWRKIMPCSKHPNKADEEACDASKKLAVPFNTR
jgi:transposase